MKPQTPTQHKNNSPESTTSADARGASVADKKGDQQGFIDISEVELAALIQRIEEAIEFNLALNPDDYRLLISALTTLATMQEQLSNDKLTLLKLRKLLGMINASEKLKDLDSGDTGEKADAEAASSSPKPKKPRSGRKDKTPRTPRAEPEKVLHPMSSMHRGDSCPCCARGKVYKHEPAVMLRITGHAPYSAKRHIREQLRCGSCGEVFGAELPAEVLADGEPGQLYGYSARSIMVIDKFFAGEPYYRQQSVQALFGIKLAPSTNFDQCESVANDVQPVWGVFLQHSANAQVYIIDDTTNHIADQKGMNKPQRGTDKQKWRTGVYTSVMLAIYDDVDDNGKRCERRLVMCQTSIGHAGEWADEVLSKRDSTLPAPIVTSDALSSNNIHEIEVIDARCNVHARRGFVEVRSAFTDAVDTILTLYSRIWINNEHCQNEQYTDEQRRDYHYRHSLPVMELIQYWCEQALTEEKHPSDPYIPESLHCVEPNSSLGKAMNYVLNRFDNLTQFCHLPSVPIDTNEVERLIKLVVRNRKNAGYFKTQVGAWIADILTSIVAICQENGVNVFEYLNAIQRNRVAVRSNPSAWLPWNYLNST